MDKLKALEFAVGSIEKKFGKGSIMRLGSRENLSIESIPTGALALDLALGVGGLPRGRIIEIYGSESSGKTTLAFHVIAESQKRGGMCAFIDAEHALDPIYARSLGVDIDNLLVSQPDNAEEALEIMDALARSNALDVIVLDSVAALVPKAEMEGEMGDAHVGMQARLMSQALRKLGGTIAQANCVTIFINQIREKIGVMFGNPETTPGGRALKFWSSVRLEVRRIDSIKQGTDMIGSRVRVKVVKNKVSVQAGRVRRDVRQGHLKERQHPRPGRRKQLRHQDGHLVHLRRNAPGPGPGERQELPRGAPGGDGGARGKDPRRRRQRESSLARRRRHRRRQRRRQSREQWEARGRVAVEGPGVSLSPPPGGGGCPSPSTQHSRGKDSPCPIPNAPPSRLSSLR